MPYISVTFVRGAEQEAQAQLIGELTDVVVERLGVPRETVSVVLHPVDPSHWGVGGTPLSEVIQAR